MQEGQIPVSPEYVVGVSFQRSGHHLMQRLLRRYIGPKFIYCPNYTKTVLGDTRNVRHNCCKETLCESRDTVSFCKNHDQAGLVPKVSGQRYLVQYREFLPAVVSNFDLIVKNKDDIDTEDDFRKFSTKRAIQYQAFIKKWVISEDPEIEKLIVKYEDFVARPVELFEQVLLLFGLQEHIDRDRIAEVVENAPKKTVVNRVHVDNKTHGISNTRKVEDFRFYSQDWFSELEELTRLAS